MSQRVLESENSKPHNPFDSMGFIRFWAVVVVFWMSFPISVVICYVFLGSELTGMLFQAMWKDFWQTLVIMLVGLLVAVSGGIFLIYLGISALFG